MRHFSRPARVTRTASTGGPVVPTTEVMSHLRVTDLGEFSDVESITDAARDWWENETGRALLNATYRMNRDVWPDDHPEDHDEWMELPRAPLNGTTNVTVKYVAEDGSTSTFSSTNYIVDDGGDHDFGRVHLKDGEDWPTETLQEADAVRVTWKAGYGSTTSDVPERVRQGLKLVAGHWFENREAITAEARPREVPMAARSLVNSNKVPTVP